VRFLSNQLAAAVQREGQQKGGLGSSDADGAATEAGDAAAFGGGATTDAAAVAAGQCPAAAATLVTAGLRDEIRAMEAYVFRLVGANLALRKSVVHSAVAEDGRVAAVMGAQSAAEAGPWKVRCARPDAWKAGEYRGLGFRGGFNLWTEFVLVLSLARCANNTKRDAPVPTGHSLILSASCSWPAALAL
jgi:hypothetical protein